MKTIYLGKIKNLNKVQFEVTQNKGTEKAFANQYWNHKEQGIYVDIISGEPLFSSLDKFDSGCGWPSFAKSLNQLEIILQDDLSHGIRRTEVLTNTCHLGHLFNDGPKDLGGMRYCINSAAINFIAKDKLLESGYGEYLTLFEAHETNGLQEAYLAGGCFWGLEHYLSKTPGVIETFVGYTGGTLDNPSYEDITTGKTGHAETVMIKYDPKKITYRKLLKVFFTIHDPTTPNQQGNDKGSQYRSAIFYLNDIQKYAALDIINLANEFNVFNHQVITEISLFKQFYIAEKYHQKYLQKHPDGYNCHFIRNNWIF